MRRSDNGHPEDDGRNLPVLARAEEPPYGTGGELPEVVEARPVARTGEASLPAPLVAAAGGFLTGFATIAAMRILRGRSARRAFSRRRRKLLQREVAGTRSFLVDVHLLKR